MHHLTRHSPSSTVDPSLICRIKSVSHLDIMGLSVGCWELQGGNLAFPGFREDFLEEVASESELCRREEWENIKQRE